LFIGRLSHQIGREALDKHFSQYGTISDIFLPASNQGKEYAIAFITYDDEKALFQALATPEHQILGQSVGVTKATPKGAARTGSGGNTRLFVGNLNPATTEMELTSHFGQYGTVTDVVIHAGKSDRGYGFVTFSNSAEMFNALGGQTPVLHGSEVKVVEAQPKPSRGAPRGGYGGYPSAYGQPAMQQGYGYGYAAPAPAPVQRRQETESYRLFITPPPDTTEAELNEYFSQFGRVTDVFMPRGKRIAFITMSTATEVYSALSRGPHVFKDFDMKAVEAQPKGASRQPSSTRPTPRVFIGRISRYHG
jgi:RNA recognition motif-containing protein